MEKMDRTGFTLVELLVTISIIAMLVGLALPAVNSVRESARNTVCKNRLRQLSLSMSNYEAANSAFPPGQLQPQSLGEIVRGVNSPMIGHLAFLLPFLEQDALHKTLEAHATLGDWRIGASGSPWYRNAQFVSDSSTSISV